MPFITLTDISKFYRIAKNQVAALSGVSLAIEKGEMVAIMGPSGSGKSTLMNIIGLLDRPSQGQLRIGDEAVHLSMSDAKLAQLRSRRIGFVFQSFNLLPRISALSNVLLPTIYHSGAKKGRVQRAKSLLTQLGLGERISHRPTELSGGEKQRVAIARALINDPDLILADEPTGNLDSKSGQEVMAILENLHKEGKTVIVITHDPAIAKRCGRTIHILDGTIQERSAHV